MGADKSSETLTDIFFDESGFTGEALLDPVQPHFVIASSIIKDAAAKKLLEAAFPDYQGPEYKFRNIWSRERSRKRLVEFCGRLGEFNSSLFVWQVDKKFCVLTKMIDYLMEPLAHAAGQNFYQNAYAYKLANYVHFGLTHVGSPELYDAAVNTYYDFARDPTDASLVGMQNRLKLLENSAPEELRFFFRSCWLGATLFHKFYDIEAFKGNLEIYLTSMLKSVGHWSLKASTPLRLFHDQSNAFFAQRELWRAITSPDVPPQFHPVANGPAIPFPLPIKMSEAVDSKTSAAIQLCDIVAGLTTKFLDTTRSPDVETLFRSIHSTGFKDIPMNGIAPGEDFPDGPPGPLTDADPVDLMVAIIESGKGKPL
jgi:hypothetical protein